MTDEEIVQLVCEGQIDEFGQLVQRYEGKLKAYTRRLINQPDEEVEDLLSEVFIKAFQNIQGFDQKKKFSSWIYRIAHNKAVDFFRKKKERVLLNEETEELIGDGKKLIEEMEMEKEKNGQIMKAVASLEMKYREVVELYFFEDKSYEEISDILHISVSAVGVLIFRAKKLLKINLRNKSL